MLDISKHADQLTKWVSFNSTGSSPIMSSSDGILI